MLNDFTGADQVYIACGYTDLRKGIDGLARLVQQQFELDPFTNTLFLFCGRRRDRIKGLYWEKDGFILLYKRLEQGAYQWPRSESEVKALTPQQYRWLMEGLQIEQPKAHRPVTGLTLVFWYNICMENKEMRTSNTEEMVTISRAEYERLQQENAQLEAKFATLEQKQAQVITSLTLQNEWLLEQLKLSKKKLFGRSSEQASRWSWIS